MENFNSIEGEGLDKIFLNSYFEEYQRLFFSKFIYKDLIAFKNLTFEIRKNGKKIILAGNGASAAISSHLAVDFTKQGKVRAINFNEAGLITCFANDFGYEMWIAKALEYYADAGDVVVLISVSGTSPNVIEAAKYARENNLKIITFTGKSPDNPLRQLGDINFWVNSNAYNIVEAIHMIWLTTVVDLIIGKAEYSVS